MVSRSLDVYVLAKLLLEQKKRPYAVVAKELGMSASEFHAAVRRLTVAGLVQAEDRSPRRKAVEDFLRHGVRYVFPAVRGPVNRGVPTSSAAAPLAELLASTEELIPVWPDAAGKHRGYAIEPLHPSAPRAAQNNSAFYEMLALIDAVREGRVRERQLAEEELHKRIYRP